MIFIIKILFLFLLAFFIRSIILFKNKWVGIDTFYHLVNAKQIRKNKKISYKFEKLIFPKEKSTSHFYPPLLQKIISFFLERYDSLWRFFSPALEMISIFILLIITSSFVDSNIILICLFVYAISPIMVLSSIVVSPKILGNLFLIISMIFLFLYFIYGNLIFLIPFMFLNIGILLSHKLATQSLIIITMVESIFFQNIFPAIFLISSFFVTYFITKGYYKKVLKKHIQVLKRYYKIGGYKASNKKRPENPLKIFMMFPFMLIIFYYIFVNGFSQ